MNHVHRWRIDEPNGTPTVAGRCQCGAERRFLASSEHEADALLASSPTGKVNPMKAYERVMESRRRSGEISHQRATQRRALNG